VPIGPGFQKEARVLTVHCRLGTASLVAAVVGFAGLGTPAAINAQSESAVAGGAVTFTKDIAPILQKNCQSCHRPSGLGVNHR